MKNFLKNLIIAVGTATGLYRPKPERPKVVEYYSDEENEKLVERLVAECNNALLTEEEMFI